MTRTTDRAFLLGTRSSIAPTRCKPFFEVNKAKPEYNSNSPEAFSLVFWGGLWGILGAFLCVRLTTIPVIILANFQSTKSRYEAVKLHRIAHRADAEMFSSRL
jgi:hypothetical protein